ncbi:hypothetical protein QTN46_02610 [Bacillus amyloliquefaciens]|uniref:hypothetical protein n=1 Tax=Bacillus amyloliquefaciens TaxID=1390 RepID=UPI0025A25CF2|nr:hypothetical protein [Bacillus amyloliquefaciens]WJM62580.1 hypothetical protein QTN46_02610 [Bacillus amyloliquefaciens]
MIIGGMNVKQLYQHVFEPKEDWAEFLGEISKKLGEEHKAESVRLTQFVKLNDKETLIVWEIS